MTYLDINNHNLYHCCHFNVVEISSRTISNFLFGSPGDTDTFASSDDNGSMFEFENSVALHDGLFLAQRDLQ